MRKLLSLVFATTFSPMVLASGLEVMLCLTTDEEMFGFVKGGENLMVHQVLPVEIVRHFDIVKTIPNGMVIEDGEEEYTILTYDEGESLAEVIIAESKEGVVELFKGSLNCYTRREHNIFK